MPEYEVNWHHRLLMQKLQSFAEGKIKKLLCFMPPQHGKSQLTSRHLPAYILGLNPDAKIVGCSYNTTKAEEFNRDVQRIIMQSEYEKLFPNTTLNSSNVKTSAKGSYLRNADVFEIVGHKGYYKSAGVNGMLTGVTADIGIIDDPVKDAVEAGSSTYRARTWDWFTKVFLTRLHNESQIIITQTRWDIDDLSGRVLRLMNRNSEWEVISLPAIKEAPTMLEDDREIGEALWPSKHSLDRLLEMKEISPRGFHALYQQDPRPFEGGLIYPRWSRCTKEEYAAIRIEPIYGLDFGYTNDPAALVELKIDFERNLIYVLQKIYATGLGINNLVSKIKACIKTPKAKIIADSADPILIDHLRSPHGLNVHKAKKGPNSISFGISAINDFEIIVVEGSEFIEEELRNYRFKEDADGNPLDEPIDDFNHSLDAIRYAGVHEIAKRNNQYNIL